jgi:hypothetical protein
VTSQPASSTSSAPVVLGRTEPRIFTPPLRPLTPETSYGFDVIEFARDVLHQPLDPWEEWAVIHGGELLEDGRPRFRKLLIIVARQNGKTFLLVVLTLYWLFVERVGLVLGTSTKLDYAAESWRKACRLARKIPELSVEVPTKGGIRKANGEQELWRADEEEEALDEGSRYKIAASNAEGGRSLTIDRLVLDELRQHMDYSAYDASVPATNAVADAQVWAITNMGSVRSIVLNDMQEAAQAFIDTGEGDPRLGLMEWSCLPDANPLDIHALAMANPNLNRRIDGDTLLGDAATAMQKGGEKLTGFKTEMMCIRVPLLDPAIDPAGWTECLDVGDLSAVRSRVALCVDISLDSQHATLVAAAVLPDGRIRVEVVAAWSGPDATRQLRRELAGKVAVVKPQVFGWFPNGPAAAVAADLADRGQKGRAAWPPWGVKVEEIRAELPAVCMGLAEQVASGQVAHSGDPLLDTHVQAAEKLARGDAWVFTRKGDSHVDAAYALAGALHLARTLPPPAPKPLLIVGRDTAS